MIKSTTRIKSHAIRNNSSDGMGFVLNRFIGSNDLESLDPFLLYDETKPQDTGDGYKRGFPYHPHRGIQMLSYTISGTLLHRDSIGNKEFYTNSGDLLFLLAGKGLSHALIPQITENNSENFWHIFFWINLWQRDKMMEPEFKTFTADLVPTFTNESCRIKVLTGSFNNITSPLQLKSITPINIFDVTILGNGNQRIGNGSSSKEEESVHRFEYIVKSNENAFFHILKGDIICNDDSIPSDHNFVEINNNNNNNTSNHVNCPGSSENGSHSAVVTDSSISIRSKDPQSEIRFLFCVGRRTDEPIVRFGPYVMNTQKEIHQCFIDFGQQ